MHGIPFRLEKRKLFYHTLDLLSQDARFFHIQDKGGINILRKLSKPSLNVFSNYL